MANKTITYYAYAATADKTRIGLMLVMRENGCQVSQSRTGQYWPNTRAGAKAAEARCGELNEEIALARNAS